MNIEIVERISKDNKAYYANANAWGIFKEWTKQDQLGNY